MGIGEREKRKAEGKRGRRSVGGCIKEIGGERSEERIEGGWRGVGTIFLASRGVEGDPTSPAGRNLLTGQEKHEKRKKNGRKGIARPDMIAEKQHGRNQLR